jgi:hypothetical protein
MGQPKFPAPVRTPRRDRAQGRPEIAGPPGARTTLHPPDRFATAS